MTARRLETRPSPMADFDLEQSVWDASSSDPAAPNYGAAMAGFMVVDGVMTVSEATQWHPQFCPDPVSGGHSDGRSGKFGRQKLQYDGGHSGGSRVVLC